MLFSVKDSLTNNAFLGYSQLINHRLKYWAWQYVGCFDESKSAYCIVIYAVIGWHSSYQLITGLATGSCHSLTNNTAHYLLSRLIAVQLRLKLKKFTGPGLSSVELTLYCLISRHRLSPNNVSISWKCGCSLCQAPGEALSCSAWHHSNDWT